MGRGCYGNEPDEVARQEKLANLHDVFVDRGDFVLAAILNAGVRTAG